MIGLPLERKTSRLEAMGELLTINELSAADFAALKAAAKRLESKNFAVVLASKVGVPIEALLHMLPKKAQAHIGTAVEKSLQVCLRVAIQAGKSDTTSARS